MGIEPMEQKKEEHTVVSRSFEFFMPDFHAYVFFGCHDCKKTKSYSLQSSTFETWTKLENLGK